MDGYSPLNLNPKNVHFTRGGQRFRDKNWKPIRDKDEDYSNEWLELKKRNGKKILKMKNNENDNFNVLREVGKKPGTSQRELSKNLGLSLGKINYCIKALRDKGLIKISNFSKNPNKLNYVYILTPKGIASKTRLTINFMKRKMREYEELKKELK